MNITRMILAESSSYQERAAVMIIGVIRLMFPKKETNSYHNKE